MIKVSVIIPVYNAEKYLRQCIDSVLGQSLKEIEVICVDDGSTDSSREILAEYANRDERVKYFFNEDNLHAGPCRNKGLAAASGEYVLFLDADDWLKENSLEPNYNTAKKHKADVLRCPALDYDNRNGSVSRSLHNGLKRVPFFLYGRALSFNKIYWLLPKISVAPWGGLFCREFLISNGIKFNDLVCVNDRSFFWESVIKARCIVFSDKQLVFYRTNLGASLVSGRIKNFDCHFRSYGLVSEYVSGFPEKIQRAVLNAELLDIANWLEQSVKTEAAAEIIGKTSDFVQNMDKFPWAGKTNEEKWNKRIAAICG